MIFYCKKTRAGICGNQAGNCGNQAGNGEEPNLDSTIFGLFYDPKYNSFIQKTNLFDWCLPSIQDFVLQFVFASDD